MSVQGSGVINKGKKKNTVVSAGLPPQGAAIAPPPVEEKERSFEESLKIFDELEIQAPASSLIIVAPLTEKRTKGGIWIGVNKSLGDDEKKDAFYQFHRVLRVADNVKDVKIGDEVWLNENRFLSPGQKVSRIDVKGLAYIRIDYYMVDAIRPYKAENYETKVDDKGKD